MENTDRATLHRLTPTDQDKTFKLMKHEANRLNSFTGKWPLWYIEPESLSECGLFYLQSKDKVQCAFCKVILNQWSIGDTPLHEHIKKNPECPFLLSKDVGNVSISMPYSSKLIRNNEFPEELKRFQNWPHLGRPKNQRMVDLRSRLATFDAWSFVTPSARTLSECGFYYTGVSDVVTCFFCGGSLENWEPDEDPWTEHRNFFPQCLYLDAVANYEKDAAKKQPSAEISNYTAPNPGESTEVVRQASDIFAPELVRRVVVQRRNTGREDFTSLSKLCEAILTLGAGEKGIDEVTSSEHQKAIEDTGASVVAASSTENVPSGSARDALICQICMDSERAIVFQPCGHLLTCRECSLMTFDCPVCRTPITGKVRTFLS